MGRIQYTAILISGIILINGYTFSQSADKVNIPVIAVLDFEPKSGVSTDLADFVTERIRIELFKTQKYKIVERKDMTTILDEQKLELAGLTGSEYAAKVGKLLSAQKILLGTISKMEDYYYINARVIDVETGVMEFGDTSESPSQSGISDACREIISRMMGNDAGTSGVNENNKSKPGENTKQDKPFNQKIAGLSTDITDFVNSTVNYFLNKMNINIDNIPIIGGKKPSIIIKNYDNPTNNSENTASKGNPDSIDQQTGQTNSSSVDENKNGTDEEYLDNYVDNVKKNRDNYIKNNKGKKPPSENKSSEENVSKENNEGQKENYMGGMGGPLIKYGFNEINFSDYNLRGNMLFVGGRGIWMINRFFGIGGGGYGGFLLNSSTEDYSLGMGYGGLILDVYYRIKWIRFDINCLIGAGGYGITDNKAIKSMQDGNNTNQAQNIVKDSGSFFVVEPTLLIAFRVVSFMEIGLTAGYTYTSRVHGNQNDFINYTAGLSLMFGTGG